MKTSPRLASRALLLMLGTLLSTGCVTPVNEGERTCPCAEGWTCCAETNLCVADATQCERRRPPPVLTAPSAPRQMQVIAEIREAALSWFEPEDDGGSPLTGYVVEVDPAEEGQQVTVDGRTARVTGLRDGAGYRFTVAARNAVGQGPKETSASVQLPDVPRAPVALTVERGDAQARVTWQRPPSDGGRSITGYVVTAHPRGVSVETDAAELTTVVAGLTNGEAFTFTVRAINAVGPGPESEPSAPAVPARRPARPASVSSRPGVRSMSVSWQAPGDTGGMPITGYVVTATPGGETQHVDGATTSTSFTGLQDDTSYGFTVAARNELGEGAAASSEPVLTPARPGAPELTEVTPDVRSLTVRWTPPFDGREPLTGFTVTAQPAGVSVDLGPDAREAVLEGLPSTQAQSITLTARNAVGQGPAASTAKLVRARPAPVEVTRLEVPSEEGGCASVSYALRQPDGERADVVVDVDADADGTFTRALQAGSAAHSGQVALATSAEGTSHAFRWNRARDLPGATDTARVRVTASVPGTPPSVRTVTVSLPATTRRCGWELDAPPVRSAVEYSSWTPYDFTPGDFDADGKQDLIVSHSDGEGASFLRGLGNGAFEPARAAGNSLWGYSVASGDLDQDGLLDLAVLDSTTSDTRLKVARGLGNGRFEYPVSTPLPNGGGASSLWVPLVHDLDGDGAPEVSVNAGSGLYVLRQTGGGGLAVAARGFTSGGPVLGGDFDRDGLQDLLTVGTSLQAFYGKGLLSFTPVYLGSLGDMVANTQVTVTSAAAADFDGDGFLDLAASVKTTLETFVVVRLNDGQGRFKQAQVLLRYDRWGGDDDQSRLTVGDLDGNGTQDVAFANVARTVVSLMLGRGDGAFESQELRGQRNMGRIAAADFDGSGRLDLALLSLTTPSVRVLRDLQPPPRAGPAGTTFSIADFDGDGWDDVASMVSSTSVQVHLTRATGAMVARGPFPTPEGTWEVVAGRFDAGPALDLLVLSSMVTDSRRALTLLRGNGDGTFATGENIAPGMRPSAMTVGDLDGDGDLDVVIYDKRQVDGVVSYDVRPLLGAGDGTFTPGTVIANHAAMNKLVLGDLDQDGRADLLTLRNEYPSFELIMFQGRADGTLAQVSQQSPIVGSCTASQLLLQDLDADGRVDVAVSCTGDFEGVLALWQAGRFWFDARFVRPIMGAAAGLAARDLDGDGWLDLAVTSQHHDAVCILPGQGKRSFGLPSCFGTLENAYRLVLLDAEHDGTPELLVGGTGDASTLLHLR